MAKAFRLKKNDLSRSIIWRPATADAPPVTGSTAVFNMKDSSDVLKVNRAAATIDEDTKGVFFQYNWVVGDTDTAGTFEAEFEITLAGGNPETHPNEENISVVIIEDIG